jgi:hypothetical protein
VLCQCNTEGQHHDVVPRRCAGNVGNVSKWWLYPTTRIRFCSDWVRNQNLLSSSHHSTAFTSPRHRPTLPFPPVPAMGQRLRRRLRLIPTAFNLGTPAGYDGQFAGSFVPMFNIAVPKLVNSWSGSRNDSEPFRRAKRGVDSHLESTS